MKNAWILAVLLGACAPSINPQMKTPTDSMVSSLRGGHDEAAAPVRPMGWADGQWIVLRTVNEKGEPAVTKMSVVGREGEGWWIETESQDYYHRNISKVLYSKQPTNADEAVEFLLKIVTKLDDAEPQVSDFSDPNNPMLAYAKSMMKGSVQNVVVTVDDATAQKEDVTVPAGTFRGCAKFVSETSFGPIREKSTSWVHPSVPLSGAVKAESADGKWKLELLDYGTSGATSRL